MSFENTLNSSSVTERALRAYVGDFVALSVVPTCWIGRSRAAIAEHVRDLLIGILRADAAYVQVQDPNRPSTAPPLVTVVGSTRGEVETVLQTRAERGLTRGLFRAAHRDLHFAGFPIGGDGELGYIAAGSRRPEFPNEFEVLLLQVAASQVAVTLRHTALLIRHEQGEQLMGIRTAQQMAVAALGLRAVTGMPCDQLFDEALVVVRDTLHVDLDEVLELAPDGQSLLFKAGIGWDPGVVGHARVNAERDFQTGYALHVREPVIVDDLRRESRFTAAPLLLEHGVVSSVSVIIHDRHRPFGTLDAHTREPRRFTPDDVHFLQSIANLLAAALQRHDVEAERETLLLQMRRAVAARERAIRVVSHDLGNPLSTIQICANALLDREPPSVTGMRHMAQIIQRSTAWMRQIVQDLLDRASLDTGQLVLDRQPTAVSDVIGAAQVMFAPVAEEQELNFVVENAADLPAVYADPRRLLQVLSNLLGNAMKFTTAGGRIVLSAYPADAAPGDAPPGALGGAVCFQVSDTGPGIPPDDLSHVFDWFWHSERAGHGGTGLGLAIASGLVEAQGGRLQVKSALGRGTTFWFTIPAVGGGA